MTGIEFIAETLPFSLFTADPEVVSQKEVFIGAPTVCQILFILGGMGSVITKKKKKIRSTLLFEIMNPTGARQVLRK